MIVIIANNVDVMNCFMSIWKKMSFCKHMCVCVARGLWCGLYGIYQYWRIFVCVRVCVLPFVNPSVWSNFSSVSQTYLEGEESRHEDAGQVTHTARVKFPIWWRAAGDFRPFISGSGEEAGGEGRGKGAEEGGRGPQEGELRKVIFGRLYDFVINWPFLQRHRSM